MDDLDKLENEIVKGMMVNFGYAVRNHRMLRDWNQSDLAKAVGISTNYISLIENGKRNPSLHVAIRICIVLGVTPSKMFQYAETTVAEMRENSWDDITERLLEEYIDLWKRLAEV